MVEQQTHGAQNAAPKKGHGSATLPLVTFVRMGQRSAGSHKPGSQVRLLNPQLAAGYANWQSGQVESLVILWVRRPPRLLSVPWSSGNDASFTRRLRWFESIRDHSTSQWKMENGQWEMGNG